MTNNETHSMHPFHAVSLSGGKDSSAMLLLMIERGLPIDAVLFADTGMQTILRYSAQTERTQKERMKQQKRGFMTA